MPPIIEQQQPITQQQDLVEQILAEVRKQAKGPLSKSAVEFVRLYYRHVPTAEILHLDPVDLAAAALSLWRFGHVRPRRTVLLRRSIRRASNTAGTAPARSSRSPMMTCHSSWIQCSTNWRGRDCRCR